MPTGSIKNYEILYMNPDGSFVGAFKADYENSLAFIVHENGFKIPAWLILGAFWK